MINQNHLILLFVDKWVDPKAYREIGYNSRCKFCGRLFCIKGFNSNKLIQISHSS